MTSLRTRHLSFLSASLFLSIVPAEAEVTASVSDCDQFFLERSPPRLPGILVGGDILNQNRFKVICQTLENQRRFVTLYDIENKIPVFSAYKYRGAEKGERPSTWYIEPQLEDEDDRMKMKNMIVAEKNKTYNHQAGISDYKRHKQFNRGHLLPNSYGFSKMDKKSTFTLTNIVPQAITFNGGSWNKMETCVKCVMDKYCINNNIAIEAFVVTGAQPSADSWHRNRINIPSVLWSAFCCYSSSMRTWIASAHWGQNVPDKPERKSLQTMTLKKLHEELSTEDSKFQVFPESQCPLNQTVTEFYPEMLKNCHCLPSIPNTSAPPTSTSGFITSTSGPASTTSTNAPPTSTSTPTTTTPGPITSMSNPVTFTSAPLTSTSGPAALTSVPIHHPFTSSGPLTSPSAPLPTTSGPATTTSTNAPPTSTSTPTTTTPGPITSTSNPVTFTSAPLTSTSGPATLTSVPMHHPVTSSGPLTSPFAPLPTTSGPATTTSTNAPPTSTSTPTTTTPGPITSTSNSVTFTSAPLTSTSGPLISASGSSTSTSVPHTATPATSAPPANH